MIKQTPPYQTHRKFPVSLIVFLTGSMLPSYKKYHKIFIMDTFYSIHPENLKAIEDFVNDKTNDIPIEAAKELQTIFFAFQRKTLACAKTYKDKALHLTKRLERINAKAEKAAEQGDFSETGLDSFDVANALLYQLQLLGAPVHNKNKIIYILFEMYSSWLASKKQRLFLEHPVATEWGPQFWRVYKRLNIKTAIPETAWKDLTSSNPAVAAFTKNAAAKYADYHENTLKDYFIKGEPYKNATAEKNGGKWNKVISDTDIYLWKNAGK